MLSVNCLSLLNSVKGSIVSAPALYLIMERILEGKKEQALLVLILVAVNELLSIEYSF